MKQKLATLLLAAALCAFAAQPSPAAASGPGKLSADRLTFTYVTAPLNVRTRHVAARDGASVEEAEAKVRRADRERAEYYNCLSDAKWGAVETYDLCLDTERLGVQGAARVIAAAAGLGAEPI